MVVDIGKIKPLLKSAEFQRLFIEELGWDRHQHDLDITVDKRRYILQSVAQKAGMTVIVHTTEPGTKIPDYATRKKLEHDVAKNHFEHIIIYTDSQKATQIWQWVKRERGKPAQCRQHYYYATQSGESLAQKLQQIAFSIEEEEHGISIVDVTTRVRSALDLERVTKRFYDRFKTEHDIFYRFIAGIPSDDLHRWYASIMLNRLMFIYFVQKKNFLNDDINYLRSQLNLSKQRGKNLYFKQFLCPLFFEGFAKQEKQRTASINKLLGKIPYLNGGLFLRHQIEEYHGTAIEIPDAAFEKIFDFFDAYQWHLDERPLRADNEINPDVLGYIFEKYINQKQMGAYYTKEDITEYISKNTVIPFLFEKAKKLCPQAFDGDKAIWNILQEDPDRYIYNTVKHGISKPFPQDIACGIQDVSQRGTWNKTAPNEYGLPTEIWREIVARRTRYEEVKTKLARGEIRDINDFITYNLNIRQFAQDVVERYDDPERLCAFWQAIKEISVLDPTCGSGAFLFAAVNILEPLYEACLDGMEEFVESPNGTKSTLAQRIPEFNRILERVDKHPSRRYFVFKSIIINNLFGVDIMEEAVEICKLRLFLKLIAQIDRVEDIEPLPDIDFNIRVGNTLVGYTTYDEVKRALRSTLDIDNAMARIDAKAKRIDSCFTTFRRKQTDDEIGPNVSDKTKLQKALKDLETELNQYLASEYSINPKNETNYSNWLASHKPFHWFIEFYGIIKIGGFDVIIGNPPFVEYINVKREYKILESLYKTASCGNLYAYVIERSFNLSSSNKKMGFIVPLSVVSTDGFEPLRQKLLTLSLWTSNYAIRPAKLFEGVEHRLSILITSNSLKRDAQSVNTTIYRKWSQEQRQYLFDTLWYNNVKNNLIKKGIPKLGSILEVDLWNKINNKSTPFKTIIVENSKHNLFYTRKFGHFVLFTNFIPLIEFEDGSKMEPTELKSESLVSDSMLQAYTAYFNSSLTFWHLVTVADCRNLNKRDVLDHPVPSFSEKEIEHFARLGKLLMKDFRKKASHTRMTYPNQLPRIIEVMHPALSKEIIDQIDMLLASHYSLSDRELDFVINYDIKYRMGCEDTEE